MFTKNMHLCFFNIKCFPTSLSPPLTLEEDEEEHDEQQQNRVIHDCMQTTSMQHKHQPLVIKNYNSIYASSKTTRPPESYSSAFASHQRFFVSSPGLSNSILDSSAPPSTDDDVGKKLVDGGVPVKKYSQDPYMDFRRSMQEMIEARESENDQSSEWEFLQELLLSYLTLNPEPTHKFIIEAFVDVLVFMML